MGTSWRLLVLGLTFGFSEISIWRLPKLSRQLQSPIFHRKGLKNLSLCRSNLFPWEAETPPYATTDDGDAIIKGSNIVEAIDAEDKSGIPIFQGEEDVIDMKNQPPLLHQPLKWPMWLLGPSVLLVTGMVPTLWLPLSSVFLGPNIAGLLSLVGLDCLFNMGATLFLLMADSCGRPPRSSIQQKSQVPLATDSGTWERACWDFLFLWCYSLRLREDRLSHIYHSSRCCSARPLPSSALHTDVDGDADMGVGFMVGADTWDSADEGAQAGW
ncbi:hypothetical protein C4D60_Mb04t35940 [Musa balbisiana]|uniref:Uncharacterized protein n=1 Tax=Musa balbisiana TaxID=52838 RepID=A0A4S8KH40_MUSBA|nr:hypothetical protein C4D60_Mb04t35940 [Musa balbisiana]